MKISDLKFGLMASLLMALFFSISANAQWDNNQYPNSGIARFRWEGVVDGTSFVRIQGRNVQVETRSGLPVQRQRYNFTDPLPRAAVDLTLNAFNGRGRVRLVQSPRPNNDFTAVVRIDDNSGGRDIYGFELQWNDRNRRDDGGGWGGNNPRNVDSVTWRGRVDGESIIRFRGDQAWDETVNGYGVSNVRYNFSAALPRQSVSVNLINAEGRGQALIVEQPSRGNDYTAAVVIRDRQSGAGNYAFTLTWEKPRYRDDDGRPDGSRTRGLRWSGHVDGSDVIFIRGNQLWIDHRSGQPVYNESHRFFQPLSNGREFVTVRKIAGRGSVRVIEQPSRNNNYTAVILVEDRDSGSDRYEIEVEW